MNDTLADLIMARVTGSGWMGKDTSGSRYPAHRDVAQRAYRLYEARGRVDGHALEDWLRAERELARR